MTKIYNTTGLSFVDNVYIIQALILAE